MLKCYCYALDSWGIVFSRSQCLGLRPIERKKNERYVWFDGKCLSANHRQKKTMQTNFLQLQGGRSQHLNPWHHPDSNAQKRKILTTCIHKPYVEMLQLRA